MSDPNQQPHWLLHRTDQMAVAGLVLLGLAATMGWWFFHGGGSGRLVEVEGAPPRTATFEVDINSADWPELAELPGVGEKLAQRIVKSRQVDGPFGTCEDLQRVSGVGQKTFESIRPHLRCGARGGPEPVPGNGREPP